MTTLFSFDELSVMERNKKLSIFCLIIRYFKLQIDHFKNIKKIYWLPFFFKTNIWTIKVIVLRVKENIKSVIFNIIKNFHFK